MGKMGKQNKVYMMAVTNELFGMKIELKSEEY